MIFKPTFNKFDFPIYVFRGTVTSFLTSDFKEKMDRLMVTRLERQTQPVVSQEGEEEEEEDEEHSQLMSFIQNCRRQQEEKDEESEEEVIGEEAEEEQEEEEEEEILISGQYQEASDYFDQSTSSLQIPSSSLLRSWSFGDNEVGDDSDRAASTSPRQDFPSQTYYHNTRQSSSPRNHPSIVSSTFFCFSYSQVSSQMKQLFCKSQEMELICGLRGQMEQLHQEMSELRKSLKSCMDLQMMFMQQSLKQEAQPGSYSFQPSNFVTLDQSENSSMEH